MTVHRYVREGRLPARKVKGRWAVTDADLRSFAEPDRPVGASAPASVGRLVTALIAGDDATSWDTALALSSDRRPDTVIAEAVVPAMREIGSRWERDEVGVDDEHRATATATRLVGRLGDLGDRRGRRHGHLVIGAPTDDDHSLPVALGAALARRERFAVTELGADVTPEAFAEAACEVADEAGGSTDISGIVVAIVVTCDRGRDGARAAAQAVRAAAPGASVLVGGGAVGDEADARSLGATEWAPGLVEALNAARG